MEVLFVLYGLVWLAQNAMVETRHAAAGTTSPRWQAKLARLAREGQPGYVPRYGSRDFFADLWGDHLKAKTEARRAAAVDKLHDVPLSERARRIFSTKAAREADLARAIAEALDIARPTPEPLDLDAELDRPTDEPIPGVTKVECVRCGRVCDVTDYWINGGEVWCVTCRDRASRPQLSLVPNPDRASARVIPVNGEQAQMSAEVTGLDPAIAHAKAVSLAHEAHAAGGSETFINGLADAGVGQETLGAVRAAQAKSQEAADHWGGVAERLIAENKTVQEAYTNSPNAGEKGFQLGGR